MQDNNLWTRAAKFAPLVAVTLSLFLLVSAWNGIKENRYIGGQGVPENVITVSGQGEVFANPDVATFSFGVDETAKTVKEAQDSATAKINTALAKVKSFGIDEKDIKTSDYSVFPKYEYGNQICTQYSCPPGRQTLVGYEVTETITVKVRKVEDAGKVLGALGDTGVTNVSGLSFTIDDPDALNREARQKAIVKAKDKANALAKDLGVSLVRIVSFSENGGGYPVPMYSKMDAVGMGGATTASAPEIPTGQNKITSNVTITYEIR